MIRVWLTRCVYGATDGLLCCIKLQEMDGVWTRDKQFHLLPLCPSWSRLCAFDEEAEAPLPVCDAVAVGCPWGRVQGVFCLFRHGEVFEVWREEIDHFDVGPVAEVLEGQAVLDLVGRNVVVGVVV